MKKLTAILMLSLTSTAAFAGAAMPPPATVPEPGMLSLLATTGIALFLVKKFRK